MQAMPIAKPIGQRLEPGASWSVVWFVAHSSLSIG